MDLTLHVVGDENTDGLVNLSDADAIQTRLGVDENDQEFEPESDWNRDGVIDDADLRLLRQNFGFVANTAPTTRQMGTDSPPRQTHIDLAKTFAIGDLFADADFDAVYASIVSVIGGDARLTADGLGLVFIPAIGRSDPATIELSATDTFGAPITASVSITISDAPLRELRFERRGGVILDTGQAQTLGFHGDFEDQDGVDIPADFVGLSTETGNAEVDASGNISGVSTGFDIVVARRDGVLDAVPVVVGEVELADQPQLLRGLTVHPAALTLVPGQSRQMRVTVDEEVLLTSAESGTRYFVSNEDILQVSEDGNVTAKSAGTATLIVIRNGAVSRVPIRVAQPVASGSSLDQQGGAIESSAGTVVTVPPNALTHPQAVSIEPLDESQLPIPVPEGWNFLESFELDFEQASVNQPMQLRIPASGLQPGQGVFVFRVGEVPTRDGGTRVVWFQDEVATVEADGFAYTNSPPWPGTRERGVHLITWGDLASRPLAGVNVIRGRLTATYPGAITPIVTPGLGGPRIAAVASYLATTVDISSLEVISLTPEGDFQFTDVGVEINSETGYGTFDAVIEAPASSPDQIPITAARLIGGDDGQPPRVEFLGTGLNNDDSVIVQFSAGGRQRFVEAEIEDGKVLSEIPDDMALGTAEISLRLTESVSVPGQSATVSSQRASEPLRLTPQATYVFTANSGTDQVNAITLGDAGDDATTQEIGATIQNAANIPVGNRPRSTAVTSDNTRAYVANRGDGTVSVIDAMALRSVKVPNPELDTNPEAEPTVDAIPLPPGARPYWIAVDGTDTYAYVTDENAGGRIYVIDIHPSSPTYHRHVHTIHVEDAGFGLRAATVDASQRWLLVTAPNRGFLKDAPFEEEESRIIAVAIEPAARPDDFVVGVSVDPVYWNEVRSFPSGQETVHIARTPAADRLVIANRSSDVQGFGIATLTGSSVEAPELSLRYVPLNLGPADDYLDVNDAQGVVITPDAKFGFVTSFSRPDTFIASRNPFSGDIPGGNTIGIIADPLGENPRLVAATRPIPGGFPDNPVVSADSRFLYVPHRRLLGPGAVFAYDIHAIAEQIEATDENLLLRRELNQIVDNAYNLELGNPQIDVRADFRILHEQSNVTSGQFVFGVPNGQENNPNGPVATGGSPQGASAQISWLQLISPLADGHGNQGLQFKWDLQREDISHVELFV
ncbi:MAG: Ig-like domain-containing protein, partial [Planctomycetota bacterium]